MVSNPLFRGDFGAARDLNRPQIRAPVLGGPKDYWAANKTMSDNLR
jgi:hypothetical protein